MRAMQIGLIGLDTSHCVAFTKLLHEEEGAWHVPGGVVTAAYPGGSPDIERSISRVGGYTATLRDHYGVFITQTPEEAAEACDALMLLSGDGRVHAKLFRRLAPYGKPVFIDKPLALSAWDAAQIQAAAQQYGVPVMSASALRYADSLAQALADGRESILGAEVHGPMEVELTQSHYFWYGIHAAEMLFSIMGPGCREVYAASSPQHDLLTGIWQDGRIGTIRGNRKGNYRFGALLHRFGSHTYVDAQASGKPIYADLLEQVMNLFKTRQSPLPFSHSIEVIAFLEAAEISRKQGIRVTV
ncbi:Gfo/Idh/MocA family oxidoreductase [Paenibacillus sp. F411]|uniref:Gfo/Idh/MocA family oxidoreductase n=1 Tax=Paenibacillus sp. F411 TaxID=2820239 RepID=UPI001AAE9D65|nr:Gfo/Idh/MocA family oxidoreductase [Paenibacillus sp. F411]MBO2944329.1 Gfo/Idh/MocA family oxidoreductase [Paenibacillus sp. F411]